MGDAEAVLRAESVTVERGDRRLLESVSFVVPAASRVLVRGPSGAGKTTLFRALGLLEPPTAGEVYVAVARALANRPAVVLADEPTGQLDADTAARVLELFVRLHEETGTALVVVSHDRALDASFDQRVRLADGRVVEPEASEE